MIAQRQKYGLSRNNLNHELIHEPEARKASLMRSTFRVLASILALGFGLGYPQHSSAADSFSIADFLKWDRPSQELFIDSAVLMAGSIASLNTDTQGQCIYNWHFTGGAKASRQKILDFMGGYKDHPPTGIIIALAQKACGPLVYKVKP